MFSAVARLWCVLALVPGQSVQVEATRGAVACIPPVNVSGEKWAQLKARQTAKIEEWLRQHLPAAGYTLIDGQRVRQALTESGLDMSREASWTAENLLAIGRACKADYVLFAAVTFTEQKEQQRIWYRDKEGRADVRVWLVDVRDGKPLVDGRTFVGRSGGNRISFDNKGSERQIQAAANAVRDALRDFLAPYKPQ